MQIKETTSNYTLQLLAVRVTLLALLYLRALLPDTVPYRSPAPAQAHLPHHVLVHENPLVLIPLCGCRSPTGVLGYSRHPLCPESPFIRLRRRAASSATSLGIAAYAAMYALHWASSPVPPLECSAVRMLGIQCCCMWLGTFRSYATRLCWAVLRTFLSFPFHGYAEHSSLLPPTYLASCLRCQSQ